MRVTRCGGLEGIAGYGFFVASLSVAFCNEQADGRSVNTLGINWLRASSSWSWERCK